MHYDLPLEQLHAYKPTLSDIVAVDFDAFWDGTIRASETRGQKTSIVPFETGLQLVESYDVTFSGFNGDPIRAWLNRPAKAKGKFPCVVQFLGYGGGRGRPEEYLFWAANGYNHVIMDLRGQGSAWGGGRGSTGSTADASSDGAPQTSGFLTRGIRSPETSYYRRLFTDAILCVRAVGNLPFVDASKIIASGASQGAAQALAAAAFSPVAGVLVDVPFLCHIAKACTMVDTDPYFEIVRYMRSHRSAEVEIKRTLSYIDAVGFASRAKAPSLFSIALMDRVIPPRTAFAAYNHYAGPKTVEVYPYADHEGGEIDHVIKQQTFLKHLLD